METIQPTQGAPEEGSRDIPLVGMEAAICTPQD